MKKALMLALLLCLPTQAAKPNWWKRAGAIAVCAAGAYDTATTFRGASLDPAATERTPWLRNGRGRPSPWRFALWEGGLCGGATWLARSKRVSEEAALAVDAFIVTPAVISGSQNLGIGPVRH
jgi:hypothetical protein